MHDVPSAEFSNGCKVFFILAASATFKDFNLESQAC